MITISEIRNEKESLEFATKDLLEKAIALAEHYRRLYFEEKKKNNDLLIANVVLNNERLKRYL